MAEFFSKLENNYKPMDPKSSKNPKSKNMEKIKLRHITIELLKTSDKIKS